MHFQRPLYHHPDTKFLSVLTHVHNICLHPHHILTLFLYLPQHYGRKYVFSNHEKHSPPNYAVDFVAVTAGIASVSPSSPLPRSTTERQQRGSGDNGNPRAALSSPLPRSSAAGIVKKICSERGNVPMHVPDRQSSVHRCSRVVWTQRKWLTFFGDLSRADDVGFVGDNDYRRLIGGRAHVL